MLLTVSFGGFAFFVMIFARLQLRTDQWLVVCLCICGTVFFGVEWMNRKGMLQNESLTEYTDDALTVSNVPQPLLNRGNVESISNAIMVMNDGDDDPIEHNPALPEWMNIEGEHIDYLLEGPPYNSVFCIDLFASKETPTFYIYALRRLETEEAASGIQSLDSKKDELLEQIIEYRESSGIRLDADLEPAINIRKNGRFYLIVSRPRRFTVNFEIQDIKPNTLHFGEYWDGPKRISLDLPLDDPDTWAGVIVGGSGSGKTNEVNALLCNLTANTSPDDIEIHLVDVAKSGLFCHGVLPHVKSTVRTREGAHLLLDDLQDHFDAVRAQVDENGLHNTEIRQVLVIVDELPQMLGQLLGNSNEDDHQRSLGESFIDRLTAAGMVWREYGFNLICIAQTVRVEYFPNTLSNNLKWRLVGSNDDATEIMRRFSMSEELKSLAGKGDFLLKAKGKEMRFQADFLDCREGDHIASINAIAEKWRHDDALLDFDGTARSHLIEQIEDEEQEITQEVDRSRLIEQYGKKIVEAADKIATHIDEFYDVDQSEWLDGGRKRLMEIAWGKFAYTPFYNEKSDLIIECILAQAHTDF